MKIGMRFESDESLKEITVFSDMKVKIILDLWYMSSLKRWGGYIEYLQEM